MRKILLSVFALCVLFGAGPARADEYEKPSLKSFMKTLVRFGALDLRRDDMIDAYGRIVECQIYFDHHRDDFKWQRIRAALRQDIKQNVESFPISYKYDATLQLDRYDFKRGLFLFTRRTAQVQSNVFSIKTQYEEMCVKDKSKFPPQNYRFVLDKPIRIEGLPLSADEGKLLLDRMNGAGNTDRFIYTRFNFRVVYIAPIVPEAEQAARAGGSSAAMVTQSTDNDAVTMDARLDSIEYFEDPERTKLIYSDRF